MQWRRLAALNSTTGGQSRARRMLCCGRRKETGRSVPDLTASPGRVPPAPQRLKDPLGGAPGGGLGAPPCVLQPDFRKVSGVSSEIFRQIEQVENEHDATTAAALEAVERRGEMIVRMLELRQVGRNNVEAANKFLALQDAKHAVQLVEIVKRPGQTLGLYIREGDGGARADGVFISRIALESAVYSSGCLKVGDEILAVNLVDVRRMSLDDVVIIMSIPRRLLLVTRARRGRAGAGSPAPVRADRGEPPPPVVVLKRDCRDERDDEHDRPANLYSHRGVRAGGDGREERGRLALGPLSPDASALDLYYPSRASSEHSAWSYAPPPPVVTEQPKSHPPHFTPYDRSYNNTLESLAEKVHSFYPLQTDHISHHSRLSSRVPRSGSEQQLPRAETHADFGRHSLLRSSLKASSAGVAGVASGAARYGAGASTTPSRFGVGSATLGAYSTGTTLGLSTAAYGAGKYGAGGAVSSVTRRNRSLDYSSDTEASCPSRAPYYMSYRGVGGVGATPHTSTLPRDISTKFNSLPRDVRSNTRLQLGRRLGSLLSDEPEPPEPPPLSSRLDLRLGSRGRLPSSPSVFTSGEYRAWLSRAPSTSALYDALRPRLPTHYSAENIHDALKNLESASGRFGSSLTLGGPASARGRLERPRHLPARSLSTQQLGAAGAVGAGGSPSARRVRQLLELGSRFTCPNPSPVPTPGARHHTRHLDINPSEFLKYKVEKTCGGGLSTSMTGLSGLAVGAGAGGGVSGMLWVHLLAGRGLRAGGGSPSSPFGAPADPATPVRDLYCVLECDRVHKARTVVRSGETQLDWDESFELELVEARALDVLVYSWDPQHRHKLCHRGAVLLGELLTRAPAHQLALKLEPRGTLYLRLRHTEPAELFRRRPAPRPLAAPATLTAQPLFGCELETVVAREPRPAHAPAVPLIVRRCVEEIERRGLDIIGLYRLCGSASKKRILREAFERNARTVELAPDAVPDINVITGLLKDYLRELPQPLVSRCLYQLTLDALGVCVADEPETNARLMSSVLECLPRAARATLTFLLDHLALVAAASDRNKMSPLNLAVALAPPLVMHAPTQLNYHQPIHLIKCLLQIWPPPKRSVRRGEPAPGPRGSRANASPVVPLTHTLPGRAPHSASPYRPPAAASAASPPPARSARLERGLSPPARVLSSGKGGQYRPQSPLRSPLPALPRYRAVAVAGSAGAAAAACSPGSPSSSSDSHSGTDTIKHGGSMSSILRQPSSPAPAVAPPAPAIPGTSAGLAVTLNDDPHKTYALPAYSSTNPFLQQYDPEEERRGLDATWRATGIFDSEPPQAAADT